MYIQKKKVFFFSFRLTAGARSMQLAVASPDLDNLYGHKVGDPTEVSHRVELSVGRRQIPV